MALSFGSVVVFYFLKLFKSLISSSRIFNMRIVYICASYVSFSELGIHSLDSKSEVGGWSVTFLFYLPPTTRKKD